MFRIYRRDHVNLEMKRVFYFNNHFLKKHDTKYNISFIARCLNIKITKILQIRFEKLLN